MGIVWRSTGIEIYGTAREKTTDATRKTLLKTNSFSFLNRNQYSPNNKIRLRLDLIM
jgi:hypothetical protein